MSGIDAIMQENRKAVAELVAAAGRCGDVWLTPTAPGKWSPSQVMEHVARALEESGRAVRGEKTKFPVMPAVVRPLLRTFFLKRVLKKGRFFKAKTNPAMDPLSGSASPAEGRARIEAALAEFESACLSCAARSSTFDSTVFGAVSLEDYGRFQALHTLHHRRQLPA